MSFIKRLFKNFWCYLLLPLIVIAVLLAMLGLLLLLVVGVLIGPMWLLDLFNIKSTLLHHLAMFWVFLVNGIALTASFSVDKNNKIKFLSWILYSIGVASIIYMIVLCIAYPSLTLYVVLTIIVIAVIVIVVTTIKEEKDG